MTIARRVLKVKVIGQGQKPKTKVNFLTQLFYWLGMSIPLQSAATPKQRLVATPVGRSSSWVSTVTS